MEPHLSSNFSHLYNLFTIRQNQVPQQARHKLQFIASRITGRPFNSSSHFDTKAPQALELTKLDSDSLQILFNTLIRTLLPDKQALSRQCKVKFTGFFQFWNDGKIELSSKQLLITVDKLTHKFKIKYLKVNQRRSKFTFDVLLKEKNIASVRFASKEGYWEFLAPLQNSILKAKQNKKQVLEQVENIVKPQGKVDSPFEVSIEEGLAFERQRIVERERDKSYFQVQEISQISERIRKEKLEQYHIIEERQNISIFQSNNQPKIHASLVVKGINDLPRVVNFYLHQQEWCSVIASEFITQETDHSLEIFRVFKKDSMFEMERGTLTKATVTCSKTTAEVIEETKNNGKRDNKLVCHVSSTAKFYRCSGGIKIFIDCSFDGKGYYQNKDSCMFLLRWFKELIFFENNLKLSQVQHHLKMLVPMCQQSKHPQQLVLFKQLQRQEQNLSKMKLSGSDYLGTSDTLDSPNSKKLETLESIFYKLKPVKPTTIPSQDYLKLVLNELHHRYYFKCRFDQSVIINFDNYTPNYILPQLLERKQYKISENKELVYIDKAVIDGQKASLIYVIKRVGANLISGKSVLNVSLPVDIFEPRTLLERSASSFGLVPDYLLPVADSDPLTQIKNVTTLFATIPTLELIMLKPFNPILGQTFQAYIKGIPIYYEQISHHPPISAFYMTCPEFTMYGNLAAFADVSLNSAIGGNQGITYIKMRNGSEFQCYFPPCQIGGLIFGDRTFGAYGKGYILEKKSQLFAQISIEKPKKGLYQKGSQKLYPGSILGGIFKIKSDVMNSIAKQRSLRKFQGLKPNDVLQKLAGIRGTWFEQVRIGKEVTSKGKVYPLEYPRVALPSDGNYRLDVLYHKMRSIPQSQKQKECLEVRQRTDRKLREKQLKLSSKKK